MIPRNKHDADNEYVSAMTIDGVEYVTISKPRLRALVQLARERLGEKVPLLTGPGVVAASSGTMIAAAYAPEPNGSIVGGAVIPFRAASILAAAMVSSKWVACLPVKPGSTCALVLDDTGAVAVSVPLGEEPTAMYTEDSFAQEIADYLGDEPAMMGRPALLGLRTLPFVSKVLDAFGKRDGFVRLYTSEDAHAPVTVDVEGGRFGRVRLVVMPVRPDRSTWRGVR